MTLPPHIGEVISASTTSFTAECAPSSDPDAMPDIPKPPPFGSFVRVGSLPQTGVEKQSDFGDGDDPFALPSRFAPKSMPSPVSEAVALYGVVVFAESGAREPGRPVTAYGLDEDELRRSQPQIYELLTSRFTAVLIGFAGADGDFRPYLPPRPPRPHARVWEVSADETRRLTERLDYLRPLFASGGSVGGGAAFPVDELVASMLKRAYHAAYAGDEDYLPRVGRALAALLPTEYDRLRAIVERIIG